MATAPVIDFDLLLAPIEGDSPAGTDISTTGLLAELNELRREDDVDSTGEWTPRDVKTANWPKLIKVGTETLATRSKDLRVAAHLAEALVRQHGMAGLRDSLRLMRELQQQYWDTVYPLIQPPPAEDDASGYDDEEGGIEMRAAAVARLDRLLPMPVKFVKVTKASHGDVPLTHADWEMGNYLDHELKGKSAEAYQQAIDEGKPTGETFRKGVAGTPRSFYENFLEDLDAATAELDQINRFLEEYYREAEDVPYLSDVGRALSKMGEMIGEIEKVTGPLRKAEPSEEGAAEAEGAMEEGGQVVRRAAFTGEGIPATPVDRDDALNRLRAVAAYFRKAEPHSPVTYLVERAIAWAAMPLDQWLAEIIKDEGQLAHIRETLGVKPAE